MLLTSVLALSENCHVPLPPISPKSCDSQPSDGAMCESDADDDLAGATENVAL